jgi:hypothetical protein
MDKVDTKGKQPQIDRFKEAARALSCDESETAFDAKLADIAKHKPASEPEPEKK